jgi:cell volume regulation protein A
MNPVFFGVLEMIWGQVDDFGFLDSIDINFILVKLNELQSFITTLSQEGPIASAHVLLLAAGVVIFSGVAGEAFFKKTGIPDVAFLMVLGVIIGPVLGIIQPEAVLQIVPYFAALALIIIMFDGGLNLDLRQIVKTAHFSFTLAILGFILSVVIATFAVHYGLGWSWLQSILLGSIVGGSSSAIVFGLVRNIRISEETKNMLSRNLGKSNCCRISVRFWSRNSMDVCFYQTSQYPTRLHAHTWNFICLILFGSLLWRIRSTNCIGVWTHAWKQK